MANGMSLEDINEAFGGAFTPDAIPEVMRVASAFADAFHVAA